MYMPRCDQSNKEVQNIKSTSEYPVLDRSTFLIEHASVAAAVPSAQTGAVQLMMALMDALKQCYRQGDSDDK